MKRYELEFRKSTELLFALILMEFQRETSSHKKIPLVIVE